MIVARRALTAAVAATAMCAAALVSAAPALAVAAPSINSVSPGSGATAGGASVTITGANFTGITAVKFGTAAGKSIKITSPTRLTVTAPPHASGLVDITVFTSHGSSRHVPADRFTYHARPAVSAVSPNAAVLGGGQRTTVTGSNFVKVTSVLFGATPGTSVSVVSPGKLLVTAPKHTAGPVDLTVRTAYGTSAPVAADRFTYWAPPTVTAVSPSAASGAGGQRVTVTGANFVHVTSVLFGTTPGTSVSVASTGKLLVTAPKHTAGDVTITVKTAYGTSATVPAGKFSYRLAPPTWGVSQTVQQLNGTPVAASCASSTDCVAVDNVGNAIVMTNGTWAAPQRIDTAKLRGISCPLVMKCVAIDELGKAVIYSNGTWTAPSPVSSDPLQQIQYLAAVSCTADTGFFCLATDGSTTATYDGTTWTLLNDLGPGTGTRTANVESVSCTGPTFCVAVDDQTQAQIFNGSLWSNPVDTGLGTYPTSVSCSSTTQCVAVDQGGSAAVFNGLSWSASALEAGNNLNSVSCATDGTCVAVDTNSNAFTYTGSTAAWSSAVTVDSADTNVAISCVSEQSCVDVEYNGHAVAFANGAWQAPVAIDGNNALTGVSCATTTFCVATNVVGELFMFHGATWTRSSSVDSVPLVSVSCPAANMCVAADANGNALRWDGNGWSAPIQAVPQQDLSTWVSCATPTFCLLIDSGGTTATYDGSAWTAAAQPVLSTDIVTAVSCPSAAHCVAVTNTGGAATFDNGTWSAPATADTTSGASLQSVSCARGVTAYCVAVDDSGNAVTYTGTTWSAPAQVLDPAYPLSVSCTSNTFCTVTNGFGSSASWDGVSWSSPQPVFASDTGVAVSCVSAKFCVAVSQEESSAGSSS